MFEEFNFIKSYKSSPRVERVGILIGFLLVENNIEFLPNVGSLYYVFLLLALVYLYSRQGLKSWSVPMILMYCACMLSIVGNSIPSFFHPWERLATFILLTLLVSPTINSEAFCQFKCSTFVAILRLLQIVVVASFVYGMMGGGYTRVYFQGVTNHSMMMGPFAALTVLYCSLKILCIGKNTKEVWIYIIVLLCGLFCLIQAASRTAFIGTLISVLTMLFAYYRNMLGKYIKVLVIIFVTISLSFPLWEGYLDKITQKNNGQAATLSVDSRESHWLQRMAEFESSPIIGIGFSSIDTGDESKGSIFDIESGKVETGSSWLSILSMTGLMGFLIFIGLYLGAVNRAWKIGYYSPSLSCFFIAVLSFWLCHMMAEGYILAGGNSLAFCVWLTLGTIYGVSTDGEQIQQLQNQLVGQDIVNLD